MKQTITEDLLKHNVFIAYRGRNPRFDEKPEKGGFKFDTKYVGVMLYYELKKSQLIDPFFAPICYGPGNSFITNIDPIMESVIAAIIITCDDMFEYTVTFDEEKGEYIVDQSDPLYVELKSFDLESVKNFTFAFTVNFLLQ